tara:strand:+ start:493 stop:903 length:411 start_codon:yes stop_codon:yes gene_type:complete
MKIIELKNNIFDVNKIQKILKSKVCLIGIFSKDCSHCINMKQEWEQLKKKIGKINSETVLLEIDYLILNTLNLTSLSSLINGLPTIMVLKNLKKIKEYSGNRTCSNMLKFFKSHIKSFKSKTIKLKKTNKSKTQKR